MNAPTRFLRSIAWGRWCSVFFSAFALTVLYQLYYTYEVLPRVYVGESVMEIRPDGTTPANAAREVEFLQAPEFLEPITADLGLDHIWAKRVYKTALDQLPPQDAATFLKNHLFLTGVAGTNIIHIRFNSEVPKEAADVANAVADRYKTLRDVAIDQRKVQEKVALQDQLAVQQAVLEERKAAGDPQQIAAQQGIVDEMTARLKLLRDGGPLEESPVEIVSRAEPPEEPSMPNYHQNFLVSLVEGLVIGFWVAMLAELAIFIARWSASTSWNGARPSYASEDY